MTTLRPRAPKLALITSLALVLALALALAIPAERAEAVMTRCGTEIFYYSDPGLTNIVGAYIWLPESCGCTLFSWGTVSPYRTIGSSTC